MKVLITGASRGIGRAMSFVFAEAGFDLWLVARTAPGLMALEQEVAARFPGRETVIFPADLGRREQVADLSRTVIDRWGGVDVLINNAGHFTMDTILGAGEGVLEQMMALNLHSAYHLCRALVPAMVARGGGHVFNICSVASLRGYADSGVYTITKHALLGLTRSLREELQDTGVRVTAVLPGPTSTASWAGAGIPEEELMRPEDVAAAVFAAWRLSPRATVEEIVLRPQKGGRR